VCLGKGEGNVKRIINATGSVLAVALLALGGAARAQTWRSALYPEDWTPGYKDAQGRFLHDFSYAGYRRGEAPIPDPPPGAAYTVNVVTQFGADNTGVGDSTLAIQRAIDDVGAAGEGIVYLPAPSSPSTA
jgi:hypothetical protein